jgi:hypothetical protein
MGNTQPNNAQDLKIQGIIGRYLELRVRGPVNAGTHLDDDSLTGFIEGTLSEREALPIVSHLTDCSFCRHKTVELVRLDLTFADLDAPVQVREASEPSSVASVLNGILSRIFGSNEAAVFAHEEKKEDEKDGEQEKKDEPEN